MLQNQETDLNCKPKDMAMVVRSLTDHPCHMAMIGRTIVTVTRLTDNNEWFIKEGSVPCPRSGACGLSIKCRFDRFSDAVLHPLDALPEAGEGDTADANALGQPA